MTREISFEAWVPDVGKVIPWDHLNIEFEDGYGGVRDNSTNDVLHDIEDQVTSYFIPMRCTGLLDCDGRDIFEDYITELEVDGEKRHFVVKIGTVFRKVMSHPDFIDDTALVAITGVYFEWDGYQLFPCIVNGIPDNERMKIVGNIYEHPHLLTEVKSNAK